MSRPRIHTAGGTFLPEEAPLDWQSFRRKPALVYATQLRNSMTIEIGDSDVVGHIGYWLIRDSDGELWFCDEESFHQLYDKERGE